MYVSICKPSTHWVFIKIWCKIKHTRRARNDFQRVEDLLQSHPLKPKDDFPSKILPKIHAKMAPRGYRNLNEILNRFWRLLGCESNAMLRTCWRPRCDKTYKNRCPQRGRKNYRKTTSRTNPKKIIQKIKIYRKTPNFSRGPWEAPGIYINIVFLCTSQSLGLTLPRLKTYN